MPDSEQITARLTRGATVLAKLKQLKQDVEARQTYCVQMLQQSDAKSRVSGRNDLSEQQELVDLLRSTAEDIRVATAYLMGMVTEISKIHR